MIYILFGVIGILVIYLGFVSSKRAQIRRELSIEKLNLKSANSDIKILRYNYTSLKKVYTSLLKKNTEKTASADH